MTQTPIIALDISYHLEDSPSSQRAFSEDAERFKAAATWIAEQFQLESITASISIVDDPTIHRLNLEYLEHDWETDVLSFVFSSDAGRIDGEVIASADTALRLHAAAGWGAEDELLLYVVHGLLHLAGADDTDNEQRTQMRALEQSCLLALGVDAASQHVQRWEDISY